MSAVLFFAALTAAQADVWVGDWLVWKAEGECTMSTIYEGGTTVAFGQQWRTNRISVSISDEHWISLGDRGGQEVRADFKLQGKLVDWDEWWSEHALIIADKDKKLFAVTAWWDGDKEGKEFWPAWMLAEGVEVRIEGRIVGRYSLKDSYNASLALHRCATAALKNDKSDPFAK